MMAIVMLVFEDTKVDTNKYSSDPELKLILSHDVSKSKLLSMIQVNVHRLLASSPPPRHDSVKQ